MCSKDFYSDFKLSNGWIGWFLPVHTIRVVLKPGWSLLWTTAVVHKSTLYADMCMHVDSISCLW